MLKLNGQNLKEALDAVAPKLSPPNKKVAVSNACQIMSAIVKTCDKPVKKNKTGDRKRRPRRKGSKNSARSSTGLIYGRIQSGKTRAMITSSALAFDNAFRVVAVITSNNNRLVGQTAQDFQGGLPGGIRVYSKTHFGYEVGQARQILKSGRGGIVLVCSKGKARLKQAIAFLHKIGAKNFPAIIFDDEGDQATLDTNTLQRSQTKPLIPPSKIHRLIHDTHIDSLRRALPGHVFVSVTGTPFGIVLQNIDNRSRPSFVELLEAGKDYVGGETFFAEKKPEANKLINLIGEDERVRLLRRNKSELPAGLKSSINFFLLAAAAAGRELGWPDDGRGYKLLCHPSVKTADQEKVAYLMRKYLDDLAPALNDQTHRLFRDIEVAYRWLKKQTPKVPGLTSLLETISDNLPSREVLVLNKNTTGDEQNYSRYFNLLIGGNTLGRGLAIKKLLVTYYVREAKVTQMDTMYQHARMFGYRKQTLPYTRVFLPPQLYERFRQIFISDETLREFIENQGASANTFPVRIAKDVRATRKCVLDARKVDVLIPGKQIYPNYPSYTGSATRTANVLGELDRLLPKYRGKQGRRGARITSREAVDLLSLIRTKGTNVWNDKKIPTILSYLGQQFKNGVILKFRSANRAADNRRGLLDTGILYGPQVAADASGDDPVLWIFETRFKNKNRPPDWDGAPFIYPTLVLPKKAQLVVYNKS